MKLRKISLLICLMLSLAVIFALSSCGGDEPPSGDNNQSSTQEESSQSTGTTDSDKTEEKPEEVKTYTVTFVQEGFADIVVEVKAGEALTDIPSPQAEEGYNVVWESVDLSAIKENLTVNAVKTIKTYTVTFVQEGFADIEITVNHGQPLTNVPTPQAVDGYNVSWEDIDLSNITADVIINALKTIKSYTIIFDSNGGTSVPAQSVGMYQKATEPAEPTRPGYVFDGWYYGKEKWSFVGFVVTEDMTLVAKWIANENTIVFDANSGEGTMENMTVATDIKVNLTANAFTKAGYTFLGWSTTPDGAVEYTDGAEYTMGAESSYTLYAVWQVNINIVAFDANGSEGEMQGLELATGVAVNLPTNAFTRTGYTFLGWSTTKGGEVEYTDGAEYIMGTENSYALYAVWQANVNTIVFDANSGEGTMANMTAATDIKVNLTANAFTKAGYTFRGWSTTPDGEVEYVDGAEYTMGTESSYTLYAVWQINTNALSFNSNGGSGTMSNVSVVSFSTTNLPANKFTKTGYTFLGWSTTKGGAVEYTDGAEYTMGTNRSNTLYAVWEINVYTISYHNEGTSNIVEFTVNDLPITLNDLPNKTDYLFDGWYNTSDFSDSIITRITTVGNVDLYAKYVLGTDGLKFTNNSGGWTISGYTGSSTSVVIPSSYKGKAVTSIAGSAFENCTSLTSVEIGDSVTSIGSYAFYGCDKLVEVYNLSSLNIAKGSVGNGYVGNYALDVYTSLEEKSKVFTTDDGFIFYDDGAVRYLIGYEGTETYLVLPDNCNGYSYKIYNYAFYYCTSLTSVVIGDGVTSIGDRAFCYCDSLRSVKIGDSVTSIGTSAFYECTFLTIVVIGDSVTSIGACAFYYCDSLTSVEIGDSVTSIGAYAFYNCTSLTSVVIGDSVTSIGACAFYYCDSLTSVVIGDSVTSIGYYAFYECTSLTSVVIPDSVTSIDDYAFYGCTSLTIYCEASSKPSGWYSKWNYSNCPVVWGYTGEKQ